MGNRKQFPQRKDTYLNEDDIHLQIRHLSISLFLNNLALALQKYMEVYLQMKCE